MNDKISFIPLGGLDEKGKDCYALEINNDIFVLDAGLALPDKNIPGVDFLLPNFDYIFQNKDRIKAYIITHGHDDVMGALQYFYRDAPAPIYCTNSTKIIMETEAKRFKLIPNFQFIIVGPSDKVAIAGHIIQFFQTAHNASYSFGVCFKTSLGNIVFTSDFIVEFATQSLSYRIDLGVIEDIAKDPTLLLIAESKGATHSGYCAPKHSIYNRLFKTFRDTSKRIFITCFWQNFYRIDEICRLAITTHKKIYFYNDYTREVMEQLMKADQSLCLSKNDIIEKEDLLRYRNNDVVILLLGRGIKLYEELKKIVNKTNEDKRIVLGENDLFINVAIPMATLETVATESMDALYRNECQIIWLKSKDIVAMHAQESDLKFMISLLKPKYYLPVRGTFVQMMANAKVAVSMNIGLNHRNVFLINNGDILSFDQLGNANITPNDKSGIMVSSTLVDGFGISKIADQIIDERKRLGEDGVVIIASEVDLDSKKIISGPDCQMRGFVFSKEAEPLLKALINIYVEEVKLALLSGVTNFEGTITNIKDRCKKFIRRENGRTPLVLPIILHKIKTTK